MQSTDSVETYAYRTKKDLVSGKEVIRCNKIIRWYKKMINFDNVTKENIKEHNPDWPQSPGHLYRILIIGDSGSGKTIIHQINHSLDIDFKDFMNLYKKCTAKQYYFLVIDATLASDNLSRFRKNLLERI